MAEIGLVASLLGISTFGIRLTTVLYNFGSTASSAREQTDYVARHVTLYSDVLEILAQRINDDEPIHSRQALDLVNDIYGHSCDLFDKIRDLLPDRADKVSFVDKIKWNFKKTKVDLLVSEIQYLKSTVNLLVSVLYAGRTIRRHKRKKKSKKAAQDAMAQFARAQTAIVEQVNAAAVKEDCQAKAEQDDQTADDEITGTNGNDNDNGNGGRVSTALVKHSPHVPPLINTTAMVQFRQLVGQASDVSEERSLVMANSVDLLRDLLDQWTNLEDDGTVTAAAAAAADGAESSAPRAADEQASSEGNTTAASPQPSEEGLYDVWRNHYLQSQKRVEELEAELSKMKTSQTTTSPAVHTSPTDPFSGGNPVIAEAVADTARKHFLPSRSSREKEAGKKTPDGRTLGQRAALAAAEALGMRTWKTASGRQDAGQSRRSSRMSSKLPKDSRRRDDHPREPRVVGTTDSRNSLSGREDMFATKAADDSRYTTRPKVVREDSLTDPWGYPLGPSTSGYRSPGDRDRYRERSRSRDRDISPGIRDRYRERSQSRDRDASLGADDGTFEYENNFNYNNYGSGSYVPPLGGYTLPYDSRQRYKSYTGVDGINDRSTIRPNIIFRERVRDDDIRRPEDPRLDKGRNNESIRKEDPRYRDDDYPYVRKEDPRYRDDDFMYIRREDPRYRDDDYMYARSKDSRPDIDRASTDTRASPVREGVRDDVSVRSEDPHLVIHRSFTDGPNIIRRERSRDNVFVRSESPLVGGASAATVDAAVNPVGGRRRNEERAPYVDRDELFANPPLRTHREKLGSDPRVNDTIRRHFYT
ncbi:hypothetical protein AYO21_05253 [Fonsecaea monophora]|uniref:Fungal N-terminal domain-containing protein n=1 Tax=Fonsecaea monophora TaxID=254056 RepID=A0A177FAU2_9EURO|nr:hypothetical protein AYO21_05253 [Fonsecaea monophora]KAH0833575.1 hypothetical protein FOPE_03290 [Fonsecaea pedrosoi]OAG40552.1 hypothetical protein AYO21_05253 [Fonsecaea monophora]